MGEWTRIEKRAAKVGGFLGWLIIGLIGGLLGAWWTWIPGLVIGAYIGYRWAVVQEMRRGIPLTPTDDDSD